MQNRNVIVSEYFQLITKLNRANHKANEKTELTFEIIFNKLQIVFKAKLLGSSRYGSLTLAVWNKRISWSASGKSEFFNLENHIAQQLRMLQDELGEKNPYALNEIQKTELINYIKENLRSLGISKSVM